MCPRNWTCNIQHNVMWQILVLLSPLCIEKVATWWWKGAMLGLRQSEPNFDKTLIFVSVCVTLFQFR